MEVESIDSKNSFFHQNNKYIEHINKDNSLEKLQAQIIENIKEDIINKLYSKFDNLNKSFNDKLEEIRKNMNEANSQINNQLNNILNQIKKDNIQENFNRNIKSPYIIKENEGNKETKKEAKYKKLNTYKNSPNKSYFNLTNANEKRNIVAKKNKNIFKENSDLLNQNQNNEVKNKKEIINSERETENERIILDLQSVDVKSNKIKKVPINSLRRCITKQEYFNNIPINIKMPDNMYLKKKINYMNNEVDEVSNIKYLNTDTDSKEQNIKKVYQSINNIFFYDYQQKYIKEKKINECQKEELKKEIFNDKIKGKNILKNYYMNYIEENILPLFKKNVVQSKLEVIKYNISIILECLEMDKNYYNNCYLQNDIKLKKINRNQSREAVLRFRKEFNINRENITDVALENKLIENNLDINKTFAKIFG